MNKITNRIVCILRDKMFGTPIKGIKAYPIDVNFKTTYPSKNLGYNEWCMEVSFGSAVVKKIF